MENMSPESLLRKAQALGDDIKEMESIYVLGAYYQAQTKIKTNRRKNMYNQLMRYAAFLTIPLFLSSCAFTEMLCRIEKVNIAIKNLYFFICFFNN